VIPPSDENASPAALLRPLRDALIGREKLIGNGRPAHREQRQNRDHREKLHDARVTRDCGQKRLGLVQFQDDPAKPS
uniref:hypothetical protein n=1 Tax=Salmonella sp. M175 TaxID=3240291 RepID=UPI00352AD20D